MASICLSQYINKELFPVISSIENLWYYLHTRYKKAGKDISSLGKIYDPDIGQHYVCKFMSVGIIVYKIKGTLPATHVVFQCDHNITTFSHWTTGIFIICIIIKNILTRKYNTEVSLLLDAHSLVCIVVLSIWASRILILIFSLGMSSEKKRLWSVLSITLQHAKNVT